MPEGDAPALLVWLVNQGVAVAVVGFVLWRLEKRMEALHEALEELTLAMLRTGAINGNSKAKAMLELHEARTEVKK